MPTHPIRLSNGASKLVLLAAALALAGCTTVNRPPPLQPVPTQPVQSNQLLPPPGATVDTGEVEVQDTTDQDIAALTPDVPQATVPDVAGPPAREDVLGQWRVSSGGSTCDMFVTLTGWEGGYRASTRGCGEVTLSQIGAWNVEGNNVVLKDTNGAPLATLARTGDSSFSGATSGGGGISMSR